jgi:hypothetical protein
MANLSLTLPKDYLARLDQERGDVSRTKYVVRLLEEKWGIPEEDRVK